MNILMIKEALIHGGKTSGGEKSLFREGREPQTWENIRTMDLTCEMLEEVRVWGEEYLKSPIKSLPYSLYKTYSETGSRHAYDRAYWERRGYLATMAVLALAFDEKKYIEALENIIWAICDEYTWCLPACMDGSISTDGIKH